MATRGRRTRAELEPAVTWEQAQAALATIRRLRLRARDREIGYLCTELVDDDDDVERVLRHVDNAPLASIARHELAAREVLVAWQWQRAQHRYETRTLGLLTIGQRLRAGDRDFGPWLSLLHPNGRWNRRQALIEKLDPYQAGPRQTRRQAAAADTETGWLASHRAVLHDVVDVLLDQQPMLSAAVPDEKRDYLDEALGALATTVVDDQPSRSFMAALRYALVQLADVTPADPIVRDALATGRHLVQQHETVTNRHAK